MVWIPFYKVYWGFFLKKHLAESQKPAFLQKLRGQYGDTSGRLERPIERVRKAKNPRDDEDDEPIYVDEESNEVISKEDYKALVKGDPQNEEASAAGKATESEDKTQSLAESSKAQSNLTEIGGQKKRKQVKVIGEENKAESEEAAKEPLPKPSAPRKPKKAKKIKLSFDEE